MATSSTRQLLSVCFFLCYMPSLSNGRVTPNFKIRAVNLGGWLVTEGWIKPSLFDGIPNKDFLDGTELQFKSVTVGKYLCAEQGGGTIIVANRTSASGWETFKLWRINETTFQFRVLNKQFMGLNYTTGNGIDVVAIANTSSETFQIVRNSDDLSRVRIKAPNGFFLQVNPPLCFLFLFYLLLKIDGFQEHWRTFIVEEDFKFISKNGINAVRIPVGWWIASDPKPPHPYIGGSLKALDHAFLWSRNYGIKVIIDLHAAPGSQNGFEHRDGFQEWGLSEQNIQQTINVIDFLTARYANNPSLYAVELINEPLAPGASLDSIIKYYKAGYEIVRKYSKTAYVVMSNRLGQADPKELFPLASGLERTVIDVHYYNLFSNVFNNMTVQQNINFINTNRTADLNLVTTSNGPLTFVGEWVAEWKVSRATREDYQKFADAQLQVHGRATFGWAYWTLKNVNNHWSLQWMIQNGYIKL
ncbi:probable glucan 1,3-beta-glucosidase A [Camellia sinensis]|uniref:probable glucan 1,3-beta-glucosidase A n=1 Tax=Camellia sinensis TaxID=4442 RepID=UPI001035BE66|nr:probable glucan 1,3-beta-glucosidase A [Camellia sinensis]